MATGNSIGETQTAAKLQAMETAKLELAGQINTQIAALIENSIANQQLNNEEAASVTKTVAASKNLIAQEIGQLLPMVSQVAARNSPRQYIQLFLKCIKAGNSWFYTVVFNTRTNTNVKKRKYFYWHNLFLIHKVFL